MVVGHKPYYWVEGLENVPSPYWDIVEGGKLLVHTPFLGTIINPFKHDLKIASYLYSATHLLPVRKGFPTITVKSGGSVSYQFNPDKYQGFTSTPTTLIDPEDEIVFDEDTGEPEKPFISEDVMWMIVVGVLVAVITAIFYAMVRKKGD